VIAGIEQLIALRARRAREHFEFVVRTARHQLQQARQEAAQAVAHVRLQAVQSIRLGSEQSRSLLGEVRHQAAAHMGAARQAAQLQLVDVLAQGRHALHTARASTQASLHGVLERAAVQATRARDNTGRAMDEVAVGARRALADGAQRSQALVREITGQGPHKTLGRGFAIVRRAGGAVVTGAAGLAAGEAIDIEFRDGTVAARTLKKEQG
jgi:exodeoxyribonuclease VII large subunit